METHKMRQLPYTVAIIKPDTASDPEKLEPLMEQIEGAGFQIFDRITLTLDKEYVANLYAKHRQKDFYPELQAYLVSGPSEVLILTLNEGDAVGLWKSLIGPSDPADAKVRAPDSLRALHGTSLIRNEFHGSDDNMQANRERDIFDLPIPVREPDFVYDKYKISLETLIKFLFPAHLEHSNVSGRLDLFALYGPIVNYHSVDLGCLCTDCARLGKQRIRETVGTRTSFKKGKLLEANKRLLEENDIVELWPDLCDNCKYHCENYSHLPSGRGGQHLLTDIEVNQLIKEINRTEIAELLQAIKGSSAKTIMLTLSLDEPKDIQYNIHHAKALFEHLETDYFNRMNFYEMQKVILEDRKIRMNHWISLITKKPVEQLPSFDQSLARVLPMSLLDLEQTEQQTGWDKSIIDQPKLGPNAEKIALLKRMHREASLIGESKALHSVDTANNVRLLRNYAPGRHGTWNNYVAIKHPQAHTHIYRRKHKEA